MPARIEPRTDMIGPLSYIGGKRRIAKQLVSLIPDHTTYVEPFAGGAQVLFHKAPSNVEVLNDLDFDIVNFFRVCQWHYAELIRYLRYCLASRRLHELHVKTNPDTLTDIQRAGRFFYLQKNSFGGLVLKHRFHYGVTQQTNYNPDRIPEPQPGLFAWKIRPNAGEARYSAEFRLTEIFPAHIPPPR